MVENYFWVGFVAAILTQFVVRFIAGFERHKNKWSNGNVVHFVGVVICIAIIFYEVEGTFAWVVAGGFLAYVAWMETATNGMSSDRSDILYFIIIYYFAGLCLKFLEINPDAIEKFKSGYFAYVVVLFIFAFIKDRFDNPESYRNIKK